ncbi:MAG: TIGR03086 family metal-binding protein [bacterium]|nr:TIGR03086 family metal-binding protein [bacterium]
MNIAELHKKACEHATRLVESVKNDQWTMSTPCTQWDVRALLNHMTYENSWVKPLIEGKTIEQVGDQFDGDLLGNNPRAAWGEATNDATKAFGKESAMKKTVHLSTGDTNGEDYAKQVFTDILIHSWDLTRGIDADDKLDGNLVKICYEMTMKNLAGIEEAREYGLYGKIVEVDKNAGLQTKLLALFGRRA